MVSYERSEGKVAQLWLAQYNYFYVTDTHARLDAFFQHPCRE